MSARVKTIDLTRLTEAEFLCDGKHDTFPQHPPAWAFSVSNAVRENRIRQPIWDLGNGYVVHALHKPGDVVVCQGASIIGIYEGQILGAEEGHRGHALGAAMVIAGAAYRVLPPMRALTTHGERALRRAWRIVNGQEVPSPLPLETRPRRFRARAADTDGELWSVESDDPHEAEAKLAHLPRVIAGERKWADLRLS